MIALDNRAVAILLGVGQRSQVSSRDRLIASTVELLRRQGYSATGVSEIARHGNAPMGSFYHHFPGGKEELAAVAIDTGAGAYAARIEHALDKDAPLPFRLSRIATLTAEALQRSDFALGCPVATTALETVTTSTVLQQRAAVALADWQTIIARAGSAAGLPHHTAAELASNVIALVEGAELIARVQHDTAPLHHAAHAIAALTTAALDTS